MNQPAVPPPPPPLLMQGSSGAPIEMKLPVVELPKSATRQLTDFSADELEQLRREYVTSKISVKALAAAHDVVYSQLLAKIHRDCWQEQRSTYWQEHKQTLAQGASEMLAGCFNGLFTNLNNAIDQERFSGSLERLPRLMDLLDRAIDLFNKVKSGDLIPVNVHVTQSNVTAPSNTTQQTLNLGGAITEEERRLMREFADLMKQAADVTAHSQEIVAPVDDDEMRVAVEARPIDPTKGERRHE